MADVITFAGLIFLLFCSMFFSSSEMAFAASNKMRLKVAADGGGKAAIAALSATEDYGRSLSTILFGNNLVNIALTSVATAWVLDRFGSRAETLATIIITFVVLLFGEVIPKVFATEFADKVVLWVARPFRFLVKLFSPVVSLVNLLMGKISHWWTPEEPEPSATVEELSELLDTIEEEGVFTETEGELIKSAIEFTDADAHDIMIPRVDMDAFDIEDGLDALLVDEDLLSYSRIPVYRESIDNIIGVLPVKSLLRAVIECDEGTDVDIESLLMPVVYAHMTRTISSILVEFRHERLQVAVVVDEFGGTMGMLTLEDIFEEIFGEIFDETDDVEQKIVGLQDGSYEVDGGVNIDDLFDEIDYEPRDFESDYNTVGGWATEVLDRFPEPGDHFTFDRLDVTVLAAQAMRVENLRIVLLPDPEEEAERERGRDKNGDGEKENGKNGRDPSEKER